MNEETLNKVIDTLMEWSNGHTLNMGGICVLSQGEIVPIGEYEDLYDGLAVFKRPENAEALIIDTSGNATDLEGNVFRVRVCVVFDGNKAYTAMDFENGDERFIDMNNEGEGALRDAMVEAWSR